MYLILNTSYKIIMIMKRKTNIILCILVSLLCTMISGCSKNGGADKGGVDAAHSYTWWTPVGEDSSYYDSYDQNPSVQYMLTKNWKGKNGKETKIDIDFQILHQVQKEIP